MLHQNSVFHGLLKLVPWHKLERSVEKHGADERSRKLTTKRHLTALLYGQFSGAIGLREIVGGMASHETRLYHLGAAPVKRSTMSDANKDRSWQIFSELFNQMLGQVHRAGCDGQPARRSCSLIRRVYGSPASARTGRHFQPMCMEPRRISSMIQMLIDRFILR